ncbi:MAG: copper chaperone PCu(A)C [Hydrogenophaga sp.]|uniref:copper chaperone PCu(A)C n=1 Tax=Hydrogenophaga sp. TaxID=1904254 RepID=UPI0025C5147D|nr:copper chaperone PCu(A)C [Hydrogenophaga sp.]MBT9550992.1 copper chaperone PCu(A)C [Hydrogenophaga sp.]
MKKILITTLLAVTASAWAQSPASVEIKDPWVRATVAQQKATGAFMQLTAKADSKLVEVKSPVAGVAEIHEMAMDKDVMKMRQVPGLALPAGKAVDLKPGGFHVMLLDLKAQVKVGDVVPFTLVFEGKDGQRESVEIKALARPLNIAAPAGGMKGEMKPAEAHKH